MTKEPLIKLKNVSKKFPGVQALTDVSFNILQGEVHALVGENGAGKSTLIKIISGAEKPDIGSEILFCGKEYHPYNPKNAMENGISTIYQVINLLPERTVSENILLGKEIKRKGFLDHKQMSIKTQEILDLLNAVTLSPNMLVGNLKIGEKQIVEIGKALVNKSKLLIMDEATAALNKTEVDALFAIIKKLRKDGVTILYVSHRLDEVFELANSVTVLRDGRHIITSDTNKITKDEMIEHMIGRKIENIFPSKHQSKTQEILKINQLSSSDDFYDITFSLNKGEILAITGLAGCGKTNLGKAIFGAQSIDSGKIFYKNNEIVQNPEESISRKIMFLPEDRKVESLLHETSIRRNISLSILGLRLLSRLGFINKNKERDVAMEQMRVLDVKATSMEQSVSLLSGGNQQKIALGRCLAIDPEIFILLEPTQGIDVGVKFEIYKFIVEQAEKGKSILLISSELPEVLGLSHRILVMHEGRIMKELFAEETDQEEILRYALGIKSEFIN